jgi:hypothetical protein
MVVRDKDLIVTSKKLLPLIITTLEGSCGFSVVFVNVYFIYLFLFDLEQPVPSSAVQEKKKEKRALTHEIPPILLDGTRIVFCDEGPDELGDGRGGRGVQLKIKRDVVFGGVKEVDDSPEELERELKEIVSWAQNEDGVQGGDGASARREDEEVAVAVRRQRGVVSSARRRGTRELLLEDVQVRVEPVRVTNT